MFFAPDYDDATTEVARHTGWTSEQEPAGKPSRVQVVAAHDVPGSGRFRPRTGALLTRIAPGDLTTVGGSSKPRAEVVWRARTFGTGDTVWVSFSSFVPPSTPLRGPKDHWTDVFQWHGDDRRVPPFFVGIDPSTAHYVGLSKFGYPLIDLGRVVPGTWQRITLGLHLSRRAEVGWAEGYLDDAATGRRMRATIEDDQRVYAKLGLYEAEGWANSDRSVYFGPMRVGPSKVAVEAE